MTEHQRILFNKILDLNHDISLMKNKVRKNEIQLDIHLIELKVLMGDAEYDKFMERGKAMFAKAI